MGIKYIANHSRFPGEIIMDGSILLDIIRETFQTILERSDKENYLNAMVRQINSYRQIQSVDSDTDVSIYDTSTGDPFYGFDEEFEKILRGDPNYIDPSIGELVFALDPCTGLPLTGF